MSISVPFCKACQSSTAPCPEHRSSFNVSTIFISQTFEQWFNKRYGSPSEVELFTFLELKEAFQTGKESVTSKIDIKV